MPGLLSVAAAPGHNGGLAQVGLLFQEAYYDVWALNTLDQSLSIVASSASATDWGALLNSDGYPTAMPSTGTWIFSQAHIYGTAGDVWVLDWEGDATVAVTSGFSGGTLTQTATSTNRREYTLGGSPVSTLDGVTVGGPLKVNVSITALPTNVSRVRLYRLVDEALLNGTGATSIFTTEFLSRVSSFGCIRFMDWNRTNSARSYSWTYRRSETACSRSGPLYNGAWFYGTSPTPSGMSNTQTVPSTLPALTNGLPVQFIMTTRPIRVQTTSVTRGSPTVINIPGHTFVGGEKVTASLDNQGGGADWQAAWGAKSTSTGLVPEYTVSVVDANNISIPLDSTAFSVPTTLDLMPVLYLTDGVISKRVYRQGLTAHFYSEFAGTYPAHFTAVYDAVLDCFVMGGDGEGNVFSAPTQLSLLITLSNYCRAHPWINYSYLADDTFWTQVATQVKSTLNSRLVPRFSPGNELWNTGTAFWQTRHAQSYAAKSGLNTGFGVTAWDLAYAKRFNEVCDLIEAVYGTGANWQMALECQQGSLSTNRLQGNATINGGSSTRYPANRADVIATAPYTDPIFLGVSGNSVNYPGLLDQVYNYTQGGASRTTAFNWMLAEMLSASTPGWQAGIRTLDTAVANVTTQASTISSAGYTGRRGTGLPQTHYEGGPYQGTVASFTSAGWPANAPTSGQPVALADLKNFFLDYLASDQAATYITQHMTDMAAAGIQFPSIYVLASPWYLGPNPAAYNQGIYKTNQVGGAFTPALTALIEWNNP